ncbi:MAG: ABC transporter ATP-binding protein [Gemmobacter sp.]
MIDLVDIVMRFPGGTWTLRLPNLSVQQGALVAIAGPSGSGKSTILNLVAGILVPERGRIVIGGQDVTAMDDAARRRFRLNRIGLIFQNFALIDYLSVEENILLPLRIHPKPKLAPAMRQRARELAETVGLADKVSRLPAQLSQGEQQRVAIARALLTRPAIILADEATGNLDPDGKVAILDLLFSQAREVSATVLAVTHDRDLFSRFDRVLDIRDLTVAT